ncbi:MAG: oxidoreductase [Deltaproteobacteria bacterium]|nr:oxidoreductase [Deltaproteobacteria bacterium]
MEARMLETKKSFCRFCHVFCGVEVDVADGRVIAVRGDRDNPVSQGYTCLKGRAEAERLYHPERLLCSLKRDGEQWSDISSGDALSEVATRLRDIVDRHGPRSVAVYVGDGGHRTSAADPSFVRKWLDALGSPGLYTSFTVDSPSLSVAINRLFGAPLPLAVFDIANADVAMFVATNPVISHLMSMPQSNPFARLRSAQQRGMKLIVVDPRRCDVAQRADVHLQVKPGEDASLLAGMIRVILEHELHDRAYAEAYLSGLDALREAVRPFDLEYVAARTEVPAEKIREAAVLFATAQSGAAQSGTGLHMARHQNLTTQLVMTLNALCGRYDRRGGMTRNPGVLTRPLPAEPGPLRMPLFSGEETHVRGIKGIFNWQGLREMPANTLAEAMLTEGPGRIRALIVNGGNPALVFPDSERVTRALSNLDLLVVNDLFLSATARFAHYVLAVKHPFERADVPKLMDVTFPFPFSQYTPALVEAPGDLLEEWEIFWDLARRLGIELDIPGIAMDRKPTADQMLDGMNAGSRIPLDEVRRYPSGHVFGDAETLVGGVVPDMIGHPDRRMAVGHPEVVAELADVRAERVVADGGYDDPGRFAFRMITYRMPEVYCTQGQNMPSLRRKRGYNPILMSPVSMRAIGVHDGDDVIVESGHGRVAGIVESSNDLRPGVIGLAHGWGDPLGPADVRERGTNVQRLIPQAEDYDPVTGLAQQSAVAVNVYPSGTAEAPLRAPDHLP